MQQTCLGPTLSLPVIGLAQPTLNVLVIGLASCSLSDTVSPWFSVIGI